MAKKPLLFFTAYPAEGHANPLLKVAHGMIARGYDVVFHCSKDFETRIRAMGAEFAEAPGFFDLVGPEVLGQMQAMPQNLETFYFVLLHVFIKPIPRLADNLGQALEDVRAREGPDRQIIVMAELCAGGVLPFRYGRPAPRGFGNVFPRTIGLSAIGLSVRSIDTAPYMLGLPPDSTGSGRLRNAALLHLVKTGPAKHALDALAEIMRQAGATSLPPGGPDPMNDWFLAPDVTLQLCSPAQEYPLSDLDPKIHFVGCLPRREPRPDDRYPDWWPEIIANSSSSSSNSNEHDGKKKRKTVVFVCQGTVARDLDQLVIPTMRAFADRADDDGVLVVAALGARGATLPEGTEVPPNARVVDYIPYDTVLEHADVMVSNAGLGALNHAVVNGVPLVLAGITEDKTEATMRATRAGYAVGLFTQNPSTERIREGVETVLSDARYKNRAMELQAQNEAMRCLDEIERWVKEFTE
ncbi:hypothetical protein DL766_000006 [Monosporascus sp. MC13-8B]|uniref:Erythromycin biosynthesis protein CIII-like C-terminal domain-containing protein n=1 Tax=Monosporascus cannonballus TaxID=155416 RepID=A0ABY0HJU1_9PEZI|nr:hypothetical protein DL762_000375 [Monosporascus cannonballus]RYP01221.1 hypothetical protein DL763_000346 [Monosporascus cannonballus]RYP40205.1 hypothetical protein DL766_000006 [Monosporascus sp. MC13-8B]